MKKTAFNDNWIFGKENNGMRSPVTLPHDAMILEKRDPKSSSGSASAFFPGGRYVYEKSFSAPKYWADKHILFEFEGVYRNAKVSINGNEAGGRSYGYIPFTVCADGLLNRSSRDFFSL
jgi:hypothetical protein